MSADELRRATSLMRERAEAAATDAPSPWTVDPMTTFGSSDHEVHDSGGTCLAYSETGHNASLDGTVAEHIASWHPAVALAVAKAMEDVADAWQIADESADGYVYDADDNHYAFEETVDGGWLNVARAYLGESA